MKLSKEELINKIEEIKKLLKKHEPSLYIYEKIDSLISMIKEDQNEE